jgi:ribonuclease J
MRLTIHRGAHEIGGTCIELVHSSGKRLILDAGRPLDAPKEATGLLPRTLDLSRPATVLICHPHQDHWGLIDELPGDWPVWTGAASARLIEITSRFARKPLVRQFLPWKAGVPFEIGPFRITPILTDHSAFDAAMLLIEADGRRLLYSGDFRRHGRKGVLVDRLMREPPRDLDLLILEGTNLGTDKPVMSEADLEEDFVELMTRKKGRIFAAWSGQNIDRTVTLYRAAKRSQRDLVIDLYTAEVLEAISDGTRLPRPGFPNLRVVLTRGLRNHYASIGREDFVARMAQHGISARALTGSRDVIMLRDGLIRDYTDKEVFAGPEDTFVWSMWRGYLEEGKPAVKWAREGGAELRFMHTSGHASAADLKAFAEAVSARRILPVHGANWAAEGQGFPGLHALADGEVMEV